MPRGSADYNNNISQVSVSNTDNGDIVASVVGVPRMDGRGRIALYDDFRLGVTGWETISSGGGSLPNISREGRWGFGSYPPVIMSPNAAGATSQMYRRLATPGVTRIGLEVGLLLYPQTCRPEIEVSCASEDGNKKIGEFYVDYTDYSFVIITPSGNYKIYTPASYTYLILKWVSVKIVIDISTGKYVRMVIGGNEFDLSAYDLGVGAVGLKGEAQIFFWAVGNNAPNYQKYYISHVIMTVDEP